MNSSALILVALREPQQLTSWDLRRWDLLLRQLRQAGLTASLYMLLMDRGLLEQVPPQPRRHLEWSAQLARRHVQSVKWEVEHIRKALQESGVKLTLLKGAAYVLADLPQARGRIFSDIDVIVPKDRLNIVESALMLHGWDATHHDPYDQRYYRTWMHELPPMQHVKRGTVIDVHHAILPVTAPIHPDSAKLLAAVVPAGDSKGISMFAPADMVLHSAVHLFHDGEFDHGLRDLVDLNGLLMHFGKEPDFWESLVVRAQELELTRPLFYALRYATLLLHTSVPQATLHAADIGRPGTLLLMLMDQLFKRALLPKHPSCDDAYTSLARFALYLRANWLRMPPLLLARHLLRKAFVSPKQQEE